MKHSKNQREVFTLSQLATTFNIEVQQNCDVLQDWLNATGTLNAIEQHLLNDIYQKTKKEGNYWNEEELKIEMIGFIFYIASINTDNQIKVFYERTISASVDGHNLKVTADCLVAKPLPFNEPAQPYYFLQEYKKGRGESKDPEAQMLTAMLIAQQKNEQAIPIYGSYLFGSRWRFCTLVNKKYCQSRDYDADEYDDLHSIVFIIRKLKEIILGIVAENT